MFSNFSMSWFSAVHRAMARSSAEFLGFEPKIAAALLNLQGRMEKVCTKTPNPICHTNEMETKMHFFQLDKFALK